LRNHVATAAEYPAIKVIELIGWIYFLSSHFRAPFLNTIKKDFQKSEPTLDRRAGTIKNEADQSRYSASSLAGSFIILLLPKG
jgi:hypothetical protein